MNWRDSLSIFTDHYLTGNRLGLITDVDGTISPIVDQPDQARITPRSRELLQSLQHHLTLVAIVSGRAAEDVAKRVGVEGLVYIGNHGLERWEDGGVVASPAAERHRPALQAAYKELRDVLLPQMTIEDKVATLSVHYRQTAEPESVATRFRPLVEDIASKHALRVFEGRMIFELRPPIEINKGTAFRDLIRDYDLDSAIYIGDDTTDVDAFIMARQLRDSNQCYALAIGAESKDMPDAVRENADYLTSGISDVEAFLEWLLKSCKTSSI